MADSRPFTVVCIVDDSRSTERLDLVENTFVAFVMANNVSQAMAAGQVQAAESGVGTERIATSTMTRTKHDRLRPAWGLGSYSLAS
jgi:hypothetical protein